MRHGASVNTKKKDYFHSKNPPALYPIRSGAYRKSGALRAWLTYLRAATFTGRDSTVSWLNANGLEREPSAEEKRGLRWDRK